MRDGTYSRFPSKKHSRNIPRPNTRAHPNWLPLRNLILANTRRIRRLAVNLIRQASIIREQISANTITHRLRRESRAHRFRVQFGKLFCVLAEPVGELEHALRSLSGVHLAPFALEGLLRGVYGGVDVRFAGGVDFVGDEGVIVRVVDCEVVAGLGVDVL